MANKFNPGDIVQLKSGGPKMTINKWVPVEGLGPFKKSDEGYMVNWFIKDDNGNDVLKVANFSEEQLETPID